MPSPPAPACIEDASSAGNKRRERAMEQQTVRISVREKEATPRRTDRHFASDTPGTRYRRERRSADELRKLKRD
jgi:DNA-nicking Smr family endonuclease